MPAATHTRWPIAVAMGVAGAVVVAVIVLAFLWPTKTTEVRDLPVGIAGPDTAVSAVETAADDASPGAVAFTAVDDRADAVARIERRELYGAILLPESQTALPEVLTAPAANPASAQLLAGVAATLQAQLQQQVAAAGGDPSKITVTVTPVVPLADADPNGTGLVAAAFPLTLGGMLGGILVSLLVTGPLRRLAALVGFAVVAGVGVTLILQTWFGFLQGDFAPVAGAVALSVFATSSFIVGCTSLIGRVGIAIGAVLTLLVGNPLAAAAVPYEFLPSPWGVIGQYLVPGASNHLLRSLSYFPDADTSMQWLVLGGWAVLGVVLTVAGHFRGQATVPGVLDEPVTGPVRAVNPPRPEDRSALSDDESLPAAGPRSTDDPADPADTHDGASVLRAALDPASADDPARAPEPLPASEPLPVEHAASDPPPATDPPPPGSRRAARAAAEGRRG